MRTAAFFASICAFAQVEVPSIGAMLDPSGAYRMVYGVAGNFTLGPPMETAVLDSLPSTVSADEAEIFVQRANASDVRFPLSAIVAMRSMSPGWVQVITPSGSYALRIEPGKEALFALPGSAVRSEVRRR